MPGWIYRTTALYSPVEVFSVNPTAGDNWKTCDEVWVNTAAGANFQSIWVGVVPETLYPTSDLSRDTWDDARGGNNNNLMWDDVDDWSTADYIDTPGMIGGTGDVFTKMHIADPLESHGPGQTHLIEARIRKENVSGTGTVQARIYLYQGATFIAQSALASDVGTSWELLQYTLTSGEKGNITNYNDLRLWVMGNEAGDGEFDRVRCLCAGIRLDIS